MDDNKIYLHATELLINSVVIVYNTGRREMEIGLSELIDTYNKYKNMQVNYEWFKQSVDTIKKDLDRMEFNNERED